MLLIQFYLFLAKADKAQHFFQFVMPFEAQYYLYEYFGTQKANLIFAFPTHKSEFTHCEGITQIQF